MLQLRHRVAVLFACVVVLGVAGQAFAQGVVLGYNAAKVLGNVTINQGTIDLTNGALIVTTSAFGYIPLGNGSAVNLQGTAGTLETGATAIYDAIQEGANFGAGGDWNGTNGILSSVAAADSNYQTAVGYLDNGTGGGVWSTFFGQPVNPNQTIIATTYYGDSFLEGTIGSDDYDIWSETMLNNGLSTFTGGMATWIDGDWYGLGDMIDNGGFDYGAWSAGMLAGLDNNNLGFNPSAVGATISAPAGSFSAVPEPGTLALLGVFLLCGFASHTIRMVRP